MKKRAFSVVCDAQLPHKSGVRGTVPTATCTTLSFISPRNSTLIQNPQSTFRSVASHAYSTRCKSRNHLFNSEDIVHYGSRRLRSDIDSINNLDEALGFYKQMGYGRVRMHSA
ncbi:uncharacterized protein LOC113776360 [Coffea eugenioides]|uniref:uncharacterized protein LOC113776360 n=1 Tax=Coffea eugenioides TaxID=49369 RepID=UPI000F60DFA9|nr:uncharacterized protein LOC113776360 [Coffea eugenioides]